MAEFLLAIERGLGNDTSQPLLITTDNTSNQRVASGEGSATRSRHDLQRYIPSHPENHDASLSAAAENLALYSISYAHRGLRVPFYEYNVLPANLSLPRRGGLRPGGIR